jgi:uncharacterized protein with von Willebrand factor type A (vWA) domain
MLMLSNQSPAPNTQGTGPTHDQQELQSMLAAVRINAKVKEEHLRNCNFKDIYSKAPLQRKEAMTGGQGSQAPDNAALEAAAKDVKELVYDMFASSKPIRKAVHEIMHGLAFHRDKLHRQGLQMGRVELCLMLDNSGSMSGKRYEVMQAAVLVLQCCKQLEWPSAVVRFGRQAGQQVLKQFHQPLTAERGQLILESLTFHEGTYPATALDFVSRNIWPQAGQAKAKAGSANQPAVHKVVLMLLDGMTQEMNPSDYTSVIQPAGIDLLVLNLKNHLQEELMSGITSLWSQVRAKYEVVDTSHLEVLPEMVASLLEQQMRKMVQAACSTSSSSSSAHQQQPGTAAGAAGAAVVAPLLAPRFTMQPLMTGASDKADEGSSGGQGASGSQSQTQEVPSFTVSPANNPLPHSQLLDAMQQTAAAQASSSKLAEQVAEATSQMQQYYSTLSSSPQHQQVVRDAEVAMQRAEQQADQLITQLRQVLEDDVLQVNKFTRRKPCEKDSVLSMKGLMNAKLTGWQDKRIFGQPLAGGKRQHTVALLLDVSQSLSQHQLQSAVATCLAMAAALSQMGIEFHVLTFGERVTLVKTADVPWDAAAMFAVLSTLSANQQTSSIDASAISAAVKLLEGSRKEKLMLVLTDGYSSQALALASALREAEAANIRVVGLAVGYEDTAVHLAYQRWIKAQTADKVPAALGTLFAANPAADGADGGEDSSGVQWSDLYARLLSGKQAPADAILSNLRHVFKPIVTQMSKEQEIKMSGVKADVSTLDVCFVLDCTGSMSAWIESAKQQIRAITEGILPKILKQHPGIQLEMRFALVGYRDISDGAHQFVIEPFVNKINGLQAKVGAAARLNET